jgi:FkbM family methyltransferase
MPANYDALIARGAHAHWLADVWSAYAIAVTSPARVPASGVIEFFSSGAVGDQQGALSPGAAYTDAAHKIAVQATTLDAHLAALGLQQTPILLLKVDTEGFDADVLLGAAAVLARQQARIITFEYNSKWAEAPGSSLAATVKALDAAAYDCFFVTPDNLVPLTGAWWHESYEIWKWSNILCFRRCDELIQYRVLAFYNKLPVDAAAVTGCAPPATCAECTA